MSFVKERFILNEHTVQYLMELVPEFGHGSFGEVIFYTRYTRTKENGLLENWNEVVKRVTEGTFSIRKDWYIKNHIHWDEDFWQHYALHFATSMFKMEWLPPGRGLWAMGSDHIYERGAMALYNCSHLTITDNIGEDIAWIMDCLMNGVGVGFTPERNDELQVYVPNHHKVFNWIVPDSREGWCDSVRMLIDSYHNIGTPSISFDYRSIRGSGKKIKTFGGTASGPGPLIDLHVNIRRFYNMYLTTGWYDSVFLKTDLANAVGCCVVAGNVRRSAEIACLPISDPVFIDLKDYEKYPYRAGHGWMSNNSVILEKLEDFTRLGEIAQRVIKNGEPGFINKCNLHKGRIGKNDKVRYDHAVAFNPCGEIPLEADGEVCNVADTLPTRCETIESWLKACEYATTYCSTVSLLPTHSTRTNRIVTRNRRIGIGLMDYTGWKHQIGQAKVITALRSGYKKIRKVNKWLANEAGIPESIRVTTVKPNGTTSKLAGRTPGASHPTFDYTLRRIRISKSSPLFDVLHSANIPHEPDFTQPEYTEIFEFPIKQGPSKPAAQINLWEQASNLTTIQREWADNAVSNTLYFKPKWELITIGWEGKVPDNHKLQGGNLYRYNPDHEEDSIEAVLASIAPLTKSVSLLPHSDVGVYKQMPEEGISKEEYQKRVSTILHIDWSKLTDHEAEPESYCTSDRCQL